MKAAGKTMKQLFAVSVLALAVIAGLACDGPAPHPATAGEQIDWVKCGKLECGSIQVPADYRDPDAGSIRIALSVHRATSPEKRIGYLLVNPGGPGGSGVAMAFGATGERTFTDEIVERFDIVGFDPRGVGLNDELVAHFDKSGIDLNALVGGGSQPEFACGDHGEQIALLASIDGDVDTPEEIALGEAAANLCIESMGPVGGLLHTAYVARDMDEIRKALGAEQVSYYGKSYGSTVGVWYATLFPESVRAMAVDGARNLFPSDPEEDEGDKEEEEAKPSAKAVQLEAALTACADPQCPIYNDGDPIGYFRQAAAKLHLVNAAVNNYPRAAHHGVNSTLRNEESWPDLWQGLFELNENDDPSILLKYARQRTSVQYLGANPPIHVNCLDSWVTDPAGQLARYTRRLDRANRNADRAPQQDDGNGGIPANATLAEILEVIDIPIPDVCPFYHQFAPEPVEGPYDGGGLPILVVGNHDDTATPFSESEEIATEVLSNGYLVETSHRKHVVYPENQCVNDHIHRALIDGELPSARRVFCEEDRTFAPAASAASVLALLLGVGIAFLIGLGVFIWWLVRKISQGRAGPNRHGPDPRASDPTAQEELP